MGILAFSSHSQMHRDLTQASNRMSSNRNRSMRAFKTIRSPSLALHLPTPSLFVFVLIASFYTCGQAISWSSSAVASSPSGLGPFSVAFAFSPSFSSTRLASMPRQYRLRQAQQGRRHRSSALVQMRDGSMVRDFKVGDIVLVNPNTHLDGMDWGGLEGTVTTTWVKYVFGVWAGFP